MLSGVFAKALYSQIETEPSLSLERFEDVNYLLCLP